MGDLSGLWGGIIACLGSVEHFSVSHLTDIPVQMQFKIEVVCSTGCRKLAGNKILSVAD